MTDTPPDISEIRVREEAKQELLQDLHVQDELTRTRDKRVRALLVSFTLLAAVLVPLVALIGGAAVRVFRWASGL